MNKSKFDLNIGEFLEDWTVEDALREIISNALDECVLSKTREPVIWNQGEYWVIEDFGRGLQCEHLTQSESEEKSQAGDAVIGKFGVGLKDALAVLHRRNIETRVITPQRTFELEYKQKSGFDDIETLHAVVTEGDTGREVGTAFHLRGVTPGQMEAAKRLFVRYAGNRVVEKGRFGEVIARPALGGAPVYIAGVQAAEEQNFLFGYNITSINSEVRKALNRERKNVSRGAYRERVKTILMDSQDPEVAQRLSEEIAKSDPCEELGWKDVAVHACVLRAREGNVVFVSAKEMETRMASVDLAKREGLQVIPVTEAVLRALKDTVDKDGNPIRTLERLHDEWAESFQFEFIDREQLKSSEQEVLALAPRIAGMVGVDIERDYHLVISETMRPEAGHSMEVVGLWQAHERRIIIKRNQLESAERFAGTLLHELSHATSGRGDVSREFEVALTEALGAVAARALNPPLQRRSWWQALFGWSP